MSAPADYYDGLLDDPGNAYGLPLEQSPYCELYVAAANLIEPGQRIVDLGCGSGRFASLVIDEATSYIGIDFSPALLAEAARYTCRADLWLLDDMMDCEIPDADVYVLMEVLEHLEDDMGLLRSIAGRGARIVASVPTFNSYSHVRCFPNFGLVKYRYAPPVVVDYYKWVGLPRPGAGFHLFAGTI